MAWFARPFEAYSDAETAIKDSLSSLQTHLLSESANFSSVWKLLKKEIGSIKRTLVRIVRQSHYYFDVKDYGAKGDGVTNDYVALADADAAAYAVGGTVVYPPGTYIVGSNITRLADTHQMKGAILKGAFTLTQTGTFRAGRNQAFDATLTVSFGQASVEHIYPQWMKQSTDTDDTNSLLWALSLPSSQYDFPGVSLGGMTYYYTQTLIISKQVQSTGALLIPGGTGNMFKLANNAALAAATSNTGVDCTILITDGGSLSNCTIFVVDAAFDVTGNQGIFLVNLQENYGKTPLFNIRMNGHSSGKFLNGCAIRYNTTCRFHGFGGSYFTQGLSALNNNICDYSALFFESIRNVSGANAFYFNSIGECTIDNLWAELGGDLARGFYFQSCGRTRVSALKLGEASSGTDWLDGVYVNSCSDMEFKNLSTTGLTFGHATTYVTSSSRIGLDDTYDAKYNSFGYAYLIENGNKKRHLPTETISLDETFRKIPLGYMPYGTVLTLAITARSNSIVTAAFDIYKLVGGSYTLRGTCLIGSITNAGSRFSNTFNIDTSAAHFVVPSTRYTLTFAAGGYTNAVAGDIGKEAVGGTSGARGALLSYDNTAKTWLIAWYSGTYTAGEAITLSSSGTGAGTLAGASHFVAYNPFAMVDLDWEFDVVNGNVFI